MDETEDLAKEIVGNRRSAFLPRHCGRYMMTFENGVYTAAEHYAHSEERRGSGSWRFLEIRGGFYIAPTPERDFAVRNAGNGFQGSLSADGFGLAMSALVQSQIAALAYEKGDEDGMERFAEAFQASRAFAIDHHPEGEAILGFLD